MKGPSKGEAGFHRASTEPPGACPLCGATQEKGTTTYAVDLGVGVVVVRDVPATICSRCGEEWIGAEAARELEKIVEDARAKRRQVEVVPFPSQRGVPV